MSHQHYTVITGSIQFRKCENIFHGRCSGIDNTIVTYGGAIDWSGGGEFRQLEVIHAPRVLVVDTHVERSTSKLVELVRNRRERQMSIVENIFNAIDAIVDKLVTLFNCADNIYSYNNQKELFEMNQHLLSSLGQFFFRSKTCATDSEGLRPPREAFYSLLESVKNLCCP